MLVLSFVNIVCIELSAGRTDEMAVNRGKKFEEVIRNAFEKVPEVSIDRLHDQMNMYKGSQNICDFIAYKKPYEYYIECKSVHGDTLSIYSNPKPDKYGNLHGFYGNITDTQWEGLLEKSKIDGVIAGVICWWVDRDVTVFMPIQFLQEQRDMGRKSIQYGLATCEFENYSPYEIKGKKKRIFFDYDMTDFFKNLEKQRKRWC